jgi:hypothetical protein
MLDFNDIPDLNSEEDEQFFDTLNVHQNTSPPFARKQVNANLFTEKLSNQFSGIEKQANDLAKTGSDNLGFFSKMMLEAKAGRMSKAQIIKALDLRFNAEYKHAAFKLSLQLDEANKAAFFEYLKRDAAQREALAAALRSADQAIAESIFTAIEHAMEARKKWKGMISRLLNNGLMSQDEARGRLALANQETEKLENNAIKRADILYAALWDKTQYALLVPIKDLLKKTSED